MDNQQSLKLYDNLNYITVLPNMALPVMPSSAIMIFGVGLHSI